MSEVGDDRSSSWNARRGLGGAERGYYRGGLREVIPAARRTTMTTVRPELHENPPCTQDPQDGGQVGALERKGEDH